MKLILPLVICTFEFLDISFSFETSIHPCIQEIWAREPTVLYLGSCIELGADVLQWLELFG